MGRGAEAFQSERRYAGSERLRAAMPFSETFVDALQEQSYSFFIEICSSRATAQCSQVPSSIALLFERHLSTFTCVVAFK